MLGLGDREAVLAAGVHVGAPVVFSAPARELGGLFVGPALDNRVGLALMDALIDADDLACELWLGATVQEENGLHGARALALAERFDAAIALDVGLVGDIPSVAEKEFATCLGDGPIVVHRDTGIVYDRLLSQHLMTLARAQGDPRPGRPVRELRVRRPRDRRDRHADRATDGRHPLHAHGLRDHPPGRLSTPPPTCCAPSSARRSPIAPRSRTSKRADHHEDRREVQQAGQNG